MTEVVCVFGEKIPSNVVQKINVADARVWSASGLNAHLWDNVRLRRFEIQMEVVQVSIFCGRLARCWFSSHPNAVVSAQATSVFAREHRHPNRIFYEPHDHRFVLQAPTHMAKAN